MSRLLTVKIIINAFKPLDDGTFNIDVVDSTGFVVELDVDNTHECSTEIQGIFEEIQKLWPTKQISLESHLLTQPLILEETKEISQTSDQVE